MTFAMRRELSAAIGTSRPSLLLAFFYVYGLGSALLIGSAMRGRGVIDLATVFWAGGDLAVVIGVGACLDRFTRSVRELRLPVPAATFSRIYAFIGAFLIVFPIVLFRIFVPDGRQLIATTLIVPLGLLLPRLARFLGLHRGWGSGASRRRRLHPVHAPGGVIRMFLGSAFAPVPLASRRFGARLVMAALWGSALVLLDQGIYIGPSSWAVPLYLGVTAGGAWIWLMTSLAGFIHGRPAAFAELALLPGLGSAPRQRRALYRALLARPMGLWAFLSALACFWVWSKTHDARPVVFMGCALAFLALFSVHSIIMQSLGTRSATTVIQAFNLSYTPLIMAYLVSRAVSYATKMPSLAGVITLGGLLLCAAVLQFTSCRYVRRLARLPHPFLQ